MHPPCRNPRILYNNLPRHKNISNQELYETFNLFFSFAEPFTLSNASRSPFDETVFAVVKRAFAKTNRFLRLRKNLSEVAPV